MSFHGYHLHYHSYPTYRYGNPFGCHGNTFSYHGNRIFILRIPVAIIMEIFRVAMEIP